MFGSKTSNTFCVPRNAFSYFSGYSMLASVFAALKAHPVCSKFALRRLQARLSKETPLIVF